MQCGWLLLAKPMFWWARGGRNSRALTCTVRLEYRKDSTADREGAWCHEMLCPEETTPLGPHTPIYVTLYLTVMRIIYLRIYIFFFYAFFNSTLDNQVIFVKMNRVHRSSKHSRFSPIRLFLRPCRPPRSQGDDSWSSTLQTAKWHRSTVNPHPDPFTWTPTWADWNVTNKTNLSSLSFSALLNCLLFKNTNSVSCTQVLMISQWKQWA